MVRVKPPSPGLLSTVLLAVLSFVFFAVLATPAWDVVGAVCVGLLVSEIDRSGRFIGITIIRVAARALPPALRQDAIDEWIDHVLETGEQGMRPVLTALSLALLATPRLAVRHRLSRLRKRAALGVGGLLEAQATACGTLLQALTTMMASLVDIPAQPNWEVNEEKLKEGLAAAFSVAFTMAFMMILSALTAPAAAAGWMFERARPRSARAVVGTSLLTWSLYGVMVFGANPTVRGVGIGIAALNLLPAVLFAGLISARERIAHPTVRLLSWIAGHDKSTAAAQPPSH